MKIAVWHNLPSGGGKRALFTHVKGLLKRGHEIKIWCPTTANEDYLPLNQLTEVTYMPLQWKDHKGNNRISRRLDLFRSTISKLEALDEHCKSAASEINAGDYHLVFVNTCQMTYCPPIGRYLRIPKVMYLQEPCRRLYESLPRLPWSSLPIKKPDISDFEHIRDLIYNYLNIHADRLQAQNEWINANHYDLILVNSYFSRESVLRAYGLDSRVCYLGIDDQLFRKMDILKENYIVGVGAILPHKNIEHIINSISLIKVKKPDLVWIGNSSDVRYEKDLLNQSKNLNVNLKFHHNVSDDKLIEFLNKAIAMAYAPRLEPFGFAPLEANACRTPVVAVAEGGIREIIKTGENGLLVDNDPESMASAISKLVNDPSYASSMGKKGMNIVRNEWSITSAIDRLERFLISSIK